MTGVQTQPGADTDCDQNLLVAKICTRLEKVMPFQKGKPRWALEKLYDQRQEVADILDEKLGTIERESGIEEVQWKNIKKCMVDTMSDLIGKVYRRAKKPILQRN